MNMNSRPCTVLTAHCVAHTGSLPYFIKLLIAAMNFAHGQHTLLTFRKFCVKKKKAKKIGHSSNKPL